MYDLVVIGAGPGGYEAAAHAGKLGKSVALIERGHLGGTCLNAGCIPSKTFLHAVHAMHTAQQAADIGLKVDGNISIDMPALLVRKQKVVETLRKGIGGLLKKNKVTLITGAARIFSPTAVAVDNQTLKTRNILIATGSACARPPIPGIDSAAVIDSTAALNLTAVPQSMVIIGGGVIGLEMACFFAQAGSTVTIIEMLPALAPMLDSDVSAALLTSLAKRGITIHLSAKVNSIQGNDVAFTDKDAVAHTAHGQFILNATGRIPVTEGLDLQKAGVDYSRRGIRVSDSGKTNIPGIWACGDVTGRCMLAHAATREGIVAVNTMFGIPDRMRYGAIPWVVYTHPEAAGVGKTEASLKAEGTPYRAVTVPMAMSGRYIIEENSPRSFVKVLAGKRYSEILGVHAVGQGSSEFIFSAAIMVELEMRAADISSVVFPHPTISEVLKEAVTHLPE